MICIINVTGYEYMLCVCLCQCMWVCINGLVSKEWYNGVAWRSDKSGLNFKGVTNITARPLTREFMWKDHCADQGVERLIAMNNPTKRANPERKEACDCCQKTWTALLSKSSSGGLRTICISVQVMSTAVICKIIPKAVSKSFNVLVVLSIGFMILLKIK